MTNKNTTRQCYESDHLIKADNLKCLVPGTPKPMNRSEVLTNDLRATVDKFKAAQQAYWQTCKSWDESHQAGEALAIQDTKAHEMQRTKDALFEAMSTVCTLSAMWIESEAE